jgi:hypothetical protein
MQSVKKQARHWKDIFRIIVIDDVVVIIGETGLAFRATNNIIELSGNGIVLGLLKLIRHYHPIITAYLN